MTGDDNSRSDYVEGTSTAGSRTSRGTEQATIVVALPADATAVGEARHLVARQWSWLAESTLADVELVVTELVSNAVRHGEPGIELRLRVDPFAVDIGVLDHGADTIPGDVTMSGGDAPSGRGLAIVDTLASFWGVEPATGSDRGKVVWASLSRPQ